MVERFTVNEDAAGSNPAPGALSVTKFGAGRIRTLAPTLESSSGGEKG